MSTATITAPITASMCDPIRPTMPARTSARVSPTVTAARHRVRLTRRGRVALLAVLVGLLLAALTVGRSTTSRAATEGTAGSSYTATTVHQGETLWAVAQRVHPGHDPRALVQRLREINHLQTASVQVGQQLLLPALS